MVYEKKNEQIPRKAAKESMKPYLFGFHQIKKLAVNRQIGILL